MQSDVQNTYDANNNNAVLGIVELFFGVQRSLNEKFTGQLGVALAGSDAAKLSGSIWHDADPNFNNFTYSAKINQARLLFKSKLFAPIDELNELSPYISAGVGAGFNHSYDFTITPKIFQEVPPPAFSTHTTTALMYTLGVGAQKTIATHWQFGMGYEFASWGKSGFSSASGQTIGTGLQLNHLYSQEVQFFISYVC